MHVPSPSHILDPLSLCKFPKSLLSLTVIAFTGNTESSLLLRITSSARSIHMLEWLYFIVPGMATTHVAPCHEANEFSKHISGISCRCWVKTQVGKGHVGALSDRFDSRSIWNSRWSRFRIETCWAWAMFKANAGSRFDSPGTTNCTIISASSSAIFGLICGRSGTYCYAPCTLTRIINSPGRCSCKRLTKKEN